jgi:choline dehydrogenase-like flavoprotein
VAEIEGSFDFIVVGAGSAGCALANRLTTSGRRATERSATERG